MRYQKPSWSVAILFLGLVPFGHAARFYVDASATPGGNGATWGTAFTHLQDALDQTVAGRGDEVWIAAGTYYPDDGATVTKGDREASFRLKDGVSLYAGFAGGEAGLHERDWDSHETILSGKIYEEQIYWSLHVCRVDVDASVVLDGLTVTGGNANGTEHGQNRGGAIGFYGNDWDHYRITIRNSTFSGNSATLTGGVASGGNWTVNNSTFSGNSAGQGGVAYKGNWTAINSTFSGNSAQFGGVAFGGNWTVINSTFSGNSTTLIGGVASGGNWTVNNSTFSGNSAVYYGGVAYEGNWTAINSTFSGNSTNWRGGVALYGNWTVNNSTFSGNSADDGGVAYEGNWTAINSTFSGNSAEYGGSVANYGNWTILNSIFDALNSSPDGLMFAEMNRLKNTLATAPSPTSLRAKNIIVGGLAVLSGTLELGSGFILDADPLFVDAADPAGPDGIFGTADDGLRLQAGSPAIGEGNADFLPMDIYDLDNNGITNQPIPLDRAGFLRVQGDGLDLGAYEFGNETSPLMALTVQATTGGSTSPSGTQNYVQGTEVTVSATPSPGYIFEDWTGDLSSSAAVFSVTLNTSISLTANFGPDTADDDNDGLTNYEEIVVYGTNPNNSDTSGDGILDGEAVAAGLNPLTNYTGVLTVVRSEPSRFDLFTEDSIYDLRMGGLMLHANGDSEIDVEFTIEESLDLESWDPLEVITRTILLRNRQFLRIGAQEAE
jgi:hypothetical protein